MLEGPQGALYGRQAAGGAILINTVDPTHELKGRFEAGYGRFHDKRVMGYFSGPLSDTLLPTTGTLSWVWSSVSTRDAVRTRLPDTAPSVAGVRLMSSEWVGGRKSPSGPIRTMLANEICEPSAKMLKDWVA